MTAKAVPPLKNSPAQSSSTFRVAIAVSLLAGTLLMFGALRFAATHMQATM
jgi:hypothetical protein